MSELMDRELCPSCERIRADRPVLHEKYKLWTVDLVLLSD